MDLKYLDMDSNLLSLEEWARQYDDIESRTVALDVVGGRTLITVLTGMREPLINLHPFGTAIKGGHDIRMRELAQYEDRDAAVRGHAVILAWMQANPSVNITQTVRRQILPDAQPPH